MLASIGSSVLPVHSEIYQTKLSLNVHSSADCRVGEKTADSHTEFRDLNGLAYHVDFVWFLNRSEIDVDLRTLVYYYGIANTGLEEWKWLFNKFMNTSEASEKSKLMYALAASRETWILNM